MKKVISLILILLSIMELSSQNNLEYQFDVARANLAQRKIREGLEGLKLVYEA